ncbi:MAG: hypothetical protein GY870_08605 [archaeon]|nr:hypothetical protein [archaeon]
MAKKLLITGPAATGKSTLRKIFFEGESQLSLLNDPLEPTYGAESYLYKLREEIGLFDLAGQENDRWLTFDKAIFKNTDIIIIILDSGDSYKKSDKFIQDILQIRKEQCKKANIYVLFHKIDQITDTQKEILKENINFHYEKQMKKTKTLKIYLTSIFDEYYAKTFNVFLEIMNEAQKRKLVELPYDLGAIRANATLFSRLKEEEVVDMKELSNDLGISKGQLQNLVANFEMGGLLKTKRMGPVLAIFLTEKGDFFYNSLIKQFFHTTEQKVEEQKEEEQPELIDIFKEMDIDQARINEDVYITKIVPNFIYGFLISDDNGRTLTIFQSYENSLIDTLNNERNENFDIELVPMFINAMQKFSQEINIEGFSGFKLQGTSIRVNSIYKNYLTFTVFSSLFFDPDIVRIEFEELFDEFGVIFKKEIDLFEKTGNATPFNKFNNFALESISNIIQKYLKLKLKEKDTFGKEQPLGTKYSMESYKKLYQQLNESNIEDIKKLKMDLLSAILDEDFITLEELMNKINTVQNIPI